jgi:site-specific DNA recombinase
MKAAIYTRVSTDRQAEDGYSLDEQERSCREHIEREGWGYVDTFRDAGVSGKLRSRPALDKLVDCLGDLDVVVVYALDRLGRSTKNLLDLWERFEQAGVALVFLREKIDTSTPAGRMTRTLLCSIAEFERDITADRVKVALDARARNGDHAGGQPPLGFSWGEEKKLVEHPAEAAVVRRIFADYVAGRSQRAIVRALNAEAIPTRGGGLWLQSTVNGVLCSCIYTGRLERKGEIIDGTHPALLNQETWSKAEQVRGRHRRTGGRRSQSEHLLTNGLLRCGRCGSAMLPRSRKDERPRYVCAGRVQHGPDHCSQPSILREALDGPLSEALSEGYFENVEAALDRWQQARVGELEIALEARDHAEGETAAIERRLARIVRGWQEEVISDEDYAAQRTDLEADRDGATAALEQADARVRQLEQTVTETDMIPVRDSLGAFKRADLEERRRILRSMFVSFELLPLAGEGAPGLQTVETEDGPALLALPSRGEGVIEHDGPDAEVTDGDRRYWLVPRLRPEYVDGDAVIRQPLPEPASPTTERLSWARRSAAARASSMSV